MDENKTEFQEFLMAEYDRYRERKRQWRPSLNEFARWLGVSSASLDHWLLGNRIPDLTNAIKLSDKLGPRVFDVLGLPRMIVLNDPKLRAVAESWEVLTDDARHEILSILERETGRVPE